MPTLTVHINGDKQQINNNTLDELLKFLQVNTTFLAVAINNDVIPSADFSTTTIKDDDRIEIIRPSCGG